ncbi:MAG: hypothetical protein K0R93_1023 [Anaerosolibacter sp.]|jgi:hypothetical protein|nr:hypothetical protein [Anaerosolibacter sp.]MDF2546125.1 hypothetical protein [Anaerosolibacter sp.]
MEEDIRELLDTICQMAEYTECDLAFIENIANKYGFTIDEDFKVISLK